MYEPIINVITKAADDISTYIDNKILMEVNTYVHVDKEELLRALKYDRDQYDAGYKDGLRDGQLKAPVEVIRCKECKWWGNELDCGGHIVGGCYFFDRVTDADGYCYVAERKEVQE